MTIRHVAVAMAWVVTLAQPLAPSAQAQATVAEQLHRGREATEKDLSRHLAFLDRKERLIRTGGTQLVFIGDSITDGWRADPQREIFEDYFGRYRPYNIGISADETQHVLWRIEHGELDGIDPGLVVLMIGTNNMANANRMSPAETADGVQNVVEAIRRKLPGARILLLGIFPRGNRPNDPLRVAVNQANTKISGLADGRMIFYEDIGARFLEPDGTLSGGIMPITSTRTREAIRSGPTRSETGSIISC